MRNLPTIVLAFALQLGVISAASAQISVAERFVQIRSVDFNTGVLELHNFGKSPQPLSGWRFCSHDENEDRRYSNASGLNGISLASGQSLFIHFNNDAAAADSINISTIGGNFALPLDTNGGYGIQIYFQTPFSSGNNIADHIQWSLDGVEDARADERSDEAQAGGVWVDQSEWINVQLDSQRINLLDDQAINELHSPGDYEVVSPFVLGDVNCDGVVNLLDVSPFVDLLSKGGFDVKADINQDGVVNLVDVQPFVQLLSGN